MKAILVLENGSIFEGVSIGSPGERIGEVILNTAVVGYQEIMTDPANAGKIIVMTYPLIGNYGVAKKFSESSKCWIAALVIKEASRIYSNWQAEGSFSDFIKKEGVVTINDVDTRTIAINIRDGGEMLGIVSSKNFKKDILLKKLKDHKKKRSNEFIREVSTEGRIDMKGNIFAPHIAVLDLGMPNSSIKQLKSLGTSLTILPYDTPAGEIMKGGFKGLIVSSGPEGDSSVPDITSTVKDLLGKIPMLGIALGHEIIGLALGAKLKKLPVGHHGVNYPVIGKIPYKGEITVQNHSLVIAEESLKDAKNVEITLRNLNDNSIEEMESKQLKFISAQYYPASPGGGEPNELFKKFLRMVSQTKPMKQKDNPASINSEVECAKT